MSTHRTVGWSAAADRPLCCDQAMELVGVTGQDRHFTCAARPRLAGCHEAVTTPWRTPKGPGGRIGDVAIITRSASPPA